MQQETLDFGTAGAAVKSYSPHATAAAAGSMIVALLLLISLSVWLAMRSGTRTRLTRGPRLSEFSPALKLLTTLVLFSLVLVQGVAAVAAYVQTQVVHDSTLEYFHYLSWARLLGTSHSHLFGFALMYGVIGLLVTLTNAREIFKCVLIAAILWSGVFDVLSWWGIKHLSSRFEWVSLTSGAISGTSSLIACALVGRSLLTKEKSGELLDPVP